MFDITCLDRYGDTIHTLTQWDINQSIYIEDHGFSTPPQFHFCNKNTEKALVVQSTLENDVLVVAIPNQLIIEPYTITMYVYIREDDTGKTLETVQFPVRQRPQPNDFEFEDNVDVVSLKELEAEIIELNNSISIAEDARVSAETIRISNENTRITNEDYRKTEETQRENNEISRKNAENTRVESEESRVNAESERVKAENIRFLNEDKRQNNEDERKATETGRVNAESERLSAENTRQINERQRVESESARVSAEIIRSNDETIRKSNENKRIESESERVKSENGRNDSESARTIAEDLRVSSESKRVNSESLRESNETIRIDNENSRQSAETERSESESSRIASEENRVNSELNRINNETNRVNAEEYRSQEENTRNDAETIRQANESIRQNNEQARQNNISTIIVEVDKATDRANTAAKNCEDIIAGTGLISSLEKGSNNGVAELDENGKVPVSQLPSFVDDVIEGYYKNGKFYTTSSYIVEIEGESGKIYIDLNTEVTYRWSGSIFVMISSSLALGETSSTAYRGDRGKIAYEHAQEAHAPSDAEVNQNAFSNVVVGSTTISADSKTDSLTLVAGSNITITPDVTNDKITIAATDTVYTHPSTHAASMITGLATVATSGKYSDLSGTPSSLPASDVSAWAKASTKPTYTYSEVGAAASGHTHNYAGSSSAGGDATNALKLGGYSASSSATANTVALRDANGYISAKYFNQSSSAETPTTSSYIVYANSDGYFRKSSLANIKTIFGLGTAAYTASTAYAAASHSHSGYAASSHNHAAGNITAGTFSATGVVAATGTDYTTNRIRNTVFTTTDPGAGATTSYANGSIICVYE